MTPTREEIERLDKQATADGFRRFMAQPLVRMALSSIPPGEHQDNLRMLIEAAFEQGFNCGATTTMVHVLSKVFEKGRPR